jgi:hypothetical protein
MRECKSIEVMNTWQMPIRQETKYYSRVRMTNSKDAHNQRSMIWRLFQLMKECRSTEVNGTLKRKIREEPKGCNRVRTSRPKAPSSH